MPTGNIGFIFHVNVYHFKHVVPTSNFEGNFSTYVIGKCFWHLRYLKSDCWISRSFYAKKILNYFGKLEFRILVEKLIIYEAHIYPMLLVQTCWLETASLCLNSQLSVNKKFSNYNCFYWYLVIRFNFKCFPL